SLLELRATIEDQSARIAALEAGRSTIGDDRQITPSRTGQVGSRSRLLAADRRGRGLRVALAAALTLAVLSGAGGIALATIPDNGTGVFHGCVSASGALRLIDPSKGASCKGNEYSVSWNQRGIAWRGAYSTAAAYNPNDAVSYYGSSYLAKVRVTPTSCHVTINSHTEPAPCIPGASTRWATLSAAGNTVLNGTAAPLGGQGGVGDFYIDTSADVLYGPKFLSCTGSGLKRQCAGVWPSQGTSLVGPPGPKGDQGDPGNQGVPGPSHVYNIYNTADNAITGSTRQVAGLQLSAGYYLVIAKLQGYNADSSTQNFRCDLYANYTGEFTNSIDFEQMSLPSQANNGAMNLQGTVYYDAPGYAVVGCSTVDGVVSFVTLSAIQVGGIN
ncbi:MAG TPA: hypothetical protein VG815_04815, partial [Chloroflexota bacterium]|nr:hypothetical protein [Chloroflexota bacterium]